MNPPVILLHGFLERAEMWTHLSIAQKENVFIPNLPGHGSNSSTLVKSMEEMAEELNKMIRQKGLSKSILIGHSMGGYLAAEYYRKWPEEVVAIILLQSQAGGDHSDKKDQRDRAIDLVRKDKRKYCSGMIRGLFGKTAFPGRDEIVKRLVDEACEMSAKAITSSLMAMKNRRNNRDILRNSHIPLIYVLGDEDPRLPKEIMIEDMKVTQPDRVEWIKNCGHMAQWEKPRELDTILNRVLHFIRQELS